VTIRAARNSDELTVEFTALDISCLGLDGGPTFRNIEAFSLQIAMRIRKRLPVTGTRSSAMAARKARDIGAGPGIDFQALLRVGRGKTLSAALGSPNLRTNVRARVFTEPN